jgi:hypothetical protein
VCRRRAWCRHAVFRLLLRGPPDMHARRSASRSSIADNRNTEIRHAKRCIARSSTCGRATREMRNVLECPHFSSLPRLTGWGRMDGMERVSKRPEASAGPDSRRDSPRSLKRQRQPTPRSFAQSLRRRVGWRDEQRYSAPQVPTTGYGPLRTFCGSLPSITPFWRSPILLSVGSIGAHRPTSGELPLWL